MKPYLALFRAGPASLHAQTMDQVQQLDSQNFDHALSWSGPVAPQAPGAVFVHACAGAKWPALAQTLAAHRELVAQYRYIWLPDDDVLCDPDTVSRLFAVCEHLGLDLAQPAFAPGSWCAHPVALQHSAFQVRFTNFVDPAAPVLSLAMLVKVLPTLVDGGSLLGTVWPRLSQLGRVAVVDAAPVSRCGPQPAATADAAAGRIVAASHFVDTPDDAMVNLGGLLASGDALCLSEHAADVEALLQAVIRSCRGLQLDAHTFTRYLARHLDAAGAAGVGAIRVALERALTAADMRFNCAPLPPDDAIADQPAAQGEADAGLARRLALQAADLHDLQARYEVVLAERAQQHALLTALSARLARAVHDSRTGIAEAAR